MNRSQKFMYNTIASVFQEIVAFVVGLILPRVMLDCYGSVVNGLISSIQQFINYFMLVEAGIGASAIYALYKPLAKNDNAAISSIVTAARKFYILSGYIFVGLTFILAFCFPFIRRTEVFSPLEIGILVLLLGCSGTLDFFILAKYNVLLTADQRYYVISLSSAVANIINTIIIVSMAYNGMSVITARTVALTSLLVRALILSWDVHRHYRFLNFRAKPDDSAMEQRWDALYLQILGIVQAGAPVIIATVFLDYKQVSVYSIFYMVAGGLNGLLSIFTSGLSASFGDVIAREETKTLQKAYKEFEFTYYALITVTYACAFVLIMPFIRIYTKGITDANYNVPIIGMLMMLNGFLSNIKIPQGMLVISAGLYRETRWQTTTQALILIISGILLAPKFGLVGILIGCILSNVYRDIDLLFFIPAHVTRLSPKLTFRRWINSCLESSLILLPFFFITVNPTNFLQWIGWAAASVCYAVGIVLVCSCFLDRQEFRNSRLRIQSLLNRTFGETEKNEDTPAE
jgi:hypothetical protein